MEYLTPLERYNHLTYSYRYMEDAYLPHITLGRFIADNPIEALQNCQKTWDRISIPSLQSADRLTVYMMGVNGAHAMTVWEKYIRFD